MRHLVILVGLVSMALLVPPAVAQEVDTVGLVDPDRARWFLRDTDGGTVGFTYGNPADFPFMGDWDCDGIDTPGVYRDSDGMAYLRNSNSTGSADLQVRFAIPDAVPLAGDWDGDGCDTLGFYRRSEGRMFLSNDLDGTLTETVYYFGDPGDKPFVADLDGDGSDELGLHRESTGFVYFRSTHTQGVADHEFFYGLPGDCLVAGDWDGNGVQSVGLFRPSEATFYLRNSNTQGFADEEFPYGMSTMMPVAGRFGVSGEPADAKSSSIIECTSQQALAAGSVGTGDLAVVPGTSGRVGSGTLFTFRVEVEEGLPVHEDDFAGSVTSILLDDRGWTRDPDIALQRVDGAADFRVILASPALADELCQPLDVHQTLSCRVGDMVILNFFRWTEAAEPFQGDLTTYRQYLVNHEVGHWLGEPHRSCPGAGQPAPVMMQQTKEVDPCEPNGWPLDREL